MKVLAAETMSSDNEWSSGPIGEVSRQNPRSPSLTLREDLSVQVPTWKYAMGDSPGGKNEFETACGFSRIAINNLKSCLTSHAEEWQKTCIAEQVAPN